MAQTVALNLSGHELVAMQFAAEFEERAVLIRKSCTGRAVSQSYFATTKAGPGFLGDLIECLRDQGFVNFGAFVKPVLSENRTLPIADFARGIADLSRSQLEKLIQFHARMEKEQGSDQGVFPPEYRRIAGYFDRATVATDSSAEAGRLVMMLSTIGRYVLELKDTFARFVPKTVDFYEQVLDASINNPLTNTAVDLLDEVHRAIDILRQNINFANFPLLELTRLHGRLRTQKNRILQFIIIQGGRLKQFSANAINAASRNIKAWRDWEAISKEDKDKPVGEAFGKSLSSFKGGLQGDFAAYETMADRIILCLKDKLTVSPYFYYMVKDIADLIEHIFSQSMDMDPRLRVQMTKTLYRMRNLLELQERVLMLEHKEVEPFPAILQKRLDYLNQEIAHVLTRGKPKEVKYMSIAFSASYKNIGRSVARVMLEGKQTDDIEKYCLLFRKRFSSIIKSSALILSGKAQHH